MTDKSEINIISNTNNINKMFSCPLCGKVFLLIDTTENVLELVKEQFKIFHPIILSNA